MKDIRLASRRRIVVVGTLMIILALAKLSVVAGCVYVAIHFITRLW